MRLFLELLLCYPGTVEKNLDNSPPPSALLPAVSQEVDTLIGRIEAASVVSEEVRYRHRPMQARGRYSHKAWTHLDRESLRLREVSRSFDSVPHFSS